jgi:hypothetical protein
MALLLCRLDLARVSLVATRTKKRCSPRSTGRAASVSSNVP